MRVVFMGTPDFAVPTLEALAKHHDVICVYTQPPRPAGKGYQLRPSAVQKKAEELGIPVRCPASLRGLDEQVEFSALKADVAVIAAYGLILPKAVLEAPKYGCINVHASLLPRWRGAAPIHRAIEAGDDKSGVTIMQMDAGLDTGDMLMTGEVAITKNTTTETLHDALAALGADLLIRTLDRLASIVPQKQPQEGVTYAHKIEKSEGFLDWSKSAEEIERKIRAFYPFPGTYFMYKDERIKVLKASLPKEKYVEIEGIVIKENPLTIACGQGAIVLERLQREGKKPMDAADFQKGFTIKKGDNVAL